MDHKTKPLLPQDIRVRLSRIVTNWRAVPEISASKLAEEYTHRHGADDRAHDIAVELLAQRFGLKPAMRRRPRRERRPK